MRKNYWHLIVDILAYVAMVGLAATGLIMLYRLPPGSGGHHGGGHGLRMLGLGRHDWGDVHAYLAYALLGLVAVHVILHWRWVTNTFGALLSRRKPKLPGAGLPGRLLLGAVGLATAAVVAAPWLVRVEGAASASATAQRGGHGWRGGRGDDAACSETCADADCRKGAGGGGRAAGRGAGGHGSRAQDGERPEGRCSHEEHAAGAGGGGHGGHGDRIRGRTTLAEAAALAGVTAQELAEALKLPPDTPGDERLGHLRQDHGLSMQDVRAAVTKLAGEKQE